MELYNNQLFSFNPFCQLMGNTGWRILDSLIYEMGIWGLQSGGSGRGPVIIISRDK
jgi:hypothetical protein